MGDYLEMGFQLLKNKNVTTFYIRNLWVLVPTSFGGLCGGGGRKTLVMPFFFLQLKIL